jgi:hypothetical protein
MPVTSPDPVTTSDADAPLTFAAYATRIGTSRPYVSKLVASGIIHGPALTPGRIAGSRLILPAIADQQRAAASPADGRARPDLPASPSSTLAAERQGLIAAQRERTEMENATRRGELIDRTVIAATLLPAGRRLTERHKQALRDAIHRRLPLHQAEAAMDQATHEFIAEITTDGGTRTDAAA